MSCLLHVLHKLDNAGFILAFDGDHAMVIRVNYLPSMVGDKEEIVIHTPAERDKCKHHGDDNVRIVCVYGPIPGIRDAGSPQHDFADDATCGARFREGGPTT